MSDFNDESAPRGARKWLKGFAAALLAAALVANLFVAAQIPRKADADREAAYRTTKLWEDVREHVRLNYVSDGEKISYENLTYNALRGMLDALDPHSQFLEPRSLKQMQEDTHQKFGGLGIEITVRDGFPTVIAPIEDTPAFFAGILPGDRITRIDGQRTERMKLSEVVDRLKGTPGTKVTVQIFRAMDKERPFREITLTRAEIRVDSVRDVKMVHEKETIGYVRITQFGERTDQELQQAMEKLEGQGVRGLVIDLRDNPGGLLDTAQRVCEKFIASGQMIVKTTGRRASQNRTYTSRGRDPRTYPLAILVNSASASASEIVAGCLQDHKRAIIVGEKTFGKGSVQTVITDLDPVEVKDKNGNITKMPVALKLTTAEYRTPSNRPIHGHGIEPDIYVPIPDEDYAKLAEQRIRDRMRDLGAIPEEPQTDEPRKESQRIEDLQLNRAVDALIGVLIFAQNLPMDPLVAAK